MDVVSDINIENAAPLPVARVTATKPKKHHKPHQDCQNCGAILVGEHCHVCGQHGHVHRSVLHVVEEVIHGITHLDSRAWRSLPMLAFRPGTLTRNYVMGKRARYVPPFAMFLFSIFAMFLVFGVSGGPGLVSKGAATKAERVQEARELLTQKEADLKEAQSEAEAAQTELNRVNALAQPEPGEVGAATGELAGTRGQIIGAQRDVLKAKAALAAAIAQPEPAKATSKSENGQGSIVSFSYDDKTDRESATAETSKATPSRTVSVELGDTDSEDIMTMLKDSMRRGDFINTPWPKLDEKIKYKTKNPDLFLYKLQNTAYKFSFLLVPLSLPFIWLMLFWKKGVTLFDHAVFALYSLSFVSFLFMAISLSARWISPAWAFSGAAIILPTHIFYQFKGAYQLKWFSAFWRTALFCLIFSWAILMAFFLTIIALGVTG